MKKFLLTLIVTMLTCLGAWADGTQTLDDKVLYVGDVEYWNPTDLIEWGTGDPAGGVSISNINGGNEFVTAVSENGSIKLTANKATTTPVVLTFTATKTYHWNPDGPATNVKECTVNVEVKGYNCVITVNPDPSGGISLDKDNTSTTYSFTTDWKKGDTSTGQSGTNTVEVGNSSIATLEYHSWENTFFLKGVSDGETSVTVKSEYQGQVESVVIPVSVSDPTIAKSIEASDVSVAYGYSETIDVQLNPATATNFTSATSDISGVTCTKVSDIVDGYFKLKVDASGVAAATTGTITITAGSVTKTINLTVTEPTALEYITLTPNEAQTIAKGGYFDVTATPYPTNAANKEIDWSYGDVITFVDNRVTGVKRGTTTLTATPQDTRAEAKSINVTVTESFEGSVNVSTTSARVGTDGTYSLNLTNEDVNESDYTVVYSSTGAAIVVNADGSFSPVSEGSAQIKAVVSPTAAGTAKGLTEGTVYSADINVGAEITATWNGSIANTSIPLGVQTTQSSDYPQAIWSESITGATTVYSVISDDETVVKGHFTLQDNKPNGFVLAGIKAGTTNVSIKAEYGVWEYPGGVATWNPITEKISDPVEVTVTPIDVKLTVSPSTDLTMDVTLTDGETRDLTTTVVDGFGVTKSASVTAGDDVVDLSINQEGTVLTIKPKAGAGVGTATVTVKAVWAKALDYPYVDKGTEEREVSFNVTVDDQTLVKTIDNPGTQDVQQGKTTVIPVAFTPTTAQFQAPTVSGSDKISVAYANGGADYTNLEVSVADDAEIGSTATVTLTPKAGSYVTDPVTFTVKVTKKELPVTDVKPQDVIHVGELCENELGIDESYGLEKDVDYTVSYVATGTNKNGQPLVSFDANGDIHGLHVGPAHITVTFAPIETSPKVSNYKAWTREMDITVVPGETELLLGVTKDVFEQGTGGSTTLNYSWSTKGYSGTPISDFTLGFDVEGTADGVSLATADTYNQKWDITVGTDAPAEQFALVVTLVPNNPEDYNTATAKVGILVKNSSAKVTISVDENGVYTVNVPSPGAFGEKLDDPVTSGTATLVGDATLQGLKDAASVKVTGLIANSDVRELVHLIGESNSSNWETAKVCTSLDMSGAQMTEEITSHNAFEPEGTANPSTSWIDDADYWNAIYKLEYLSLPKPSPSYTTLPSNMYALYLLNPVSLNTLIIPEGWTEIKEQAFSDKAGNPTKSLTKLELPNSVEKIGAYAFSNLMVKVLNMPEKIQRIDEYAFAPCSKLEDVYFYGPAPSFVHTFAFGGDSQMCNNTVNDGLYNDRYEPETTRFNYQVASVLACLLHYPKEYQKDYIDMTRVYETCPVDQLYHKGNSENTYHVPGWTAAVINGILNHPDHNDVAQVHNRVDFGVKDKYYGYNMVWPSQSQMTMGFALSQAGYTWEGNALRTADQYNPSATYENGLVDKRGLYQFMTTMGNSTIHFTYEQDEWYTISLPFNMTPAEIQRIFGPQTQVCRFSKVVRETNEEAKEIRLEFRNSVMEDALTAETDYVGTHYDEYGDWDAENNWVVEPAFDKPGIIHHYPYMIKPSGTVNEDPAIKIDGTKRIFNGRGFERISGTLHHDAIVPVKSEGSYSFTYDFCPILEDGDIKPYSYVLVDNGPKKHEYVFYKGVKKDGAYVAGGKANQNTAYVQMPIEAEMVDGGDPEVTDWGYLDYITFFTSSSSSHAPINASVFGDDEVTGIEKVVIVCGTDKVADNKVYTINGQLVNGNVLAPGLYIKNGKKFIVK